jgi:hypothetical protein
LTNVDADHGDRRPALDERHRAASDSRSAPQRTERESRRLPLWFGTKRQRDNRPLWPTSDLFASCLPSAAG